MASFPQSLSHFLLFSPASPSPPRSRSDIKLPRALPPPEGPGADALSQQICDLLKDEKDFYVIVQVACGTEQIMDVKVMTESK